MSVMRFLEMLSLLSVVLMVHHVSVHCTDCVPKDGEDNTLPMKRQQHSPSRIFCGHILALVEKRNQVNNDSQYAEAEDQGVNEDIDYNTDSDQDLDKMMGGHYAQLGEVPWHANIMLETNNKQMIPFCAAAILNDYWLLSAAQCFRDVADWSKLSVLVGDHTRDRSDPGEQSFKIGNFIIHENYKHGSDDYNIVMVNLLRKPGAAGIQFNKFIQPVCLPNDGEIYRGNETLIISGMGLTLNDPRNERYATVVKRLNISPGGCTDSVVQTKRIFCLSSTQSELICAGDTGAPAVAKNGRVHVLYGIVAYDDTEGCQGRTVVAKVYEYRKWITDIIRDFSHAEQGDIPSRGF